MPLGLLSLAANAKINGVQVKIYKPTIPLLTNSDFKKVASDILKNKPRIIGFSTWCITYPASLLIAKELKSQSPEIPIIFGGPQASILAKETLDNFPFIDFILSGEADISFPQFTNEFTKSNPDFSKISGLSFRTSNGQICHNKLNGIVNNLDDLPVPAYNLVPRLKWMKLDVGRGCPYQCTYCSTSDFFSKRYRVKSADRIIEEMMLAYQNKGIQSFSFSHDMFTLNKKFVFELCDKLIQIKKTKGIKFKWNCSARTDCVSEEMLTKMKDAGCSDIFFGIETGSEKMQKIIKKNLNISKAYEMADTCRLLNIRMHASFIIGFPEETKKDINETLQSMLLLAIKGALTQVSELTLLPGTPIYNTYHTKLKYDGQFSNFSRNYCCDNEVELIKKYPGIFSSFYYLPVKHIGRKEMLFLRFVINKSKDFRNTLFILSELVQNDIKQTDLLQLYKNEFKSVKKEKREQNPIAMHWIKTIESYMVKNSSRIPNTYLRDIFEFESYASLLTTLYSSWQFIKPNIDSSISNKNFIIKPTPIWKVITLNYKLESILPSENSWKSNSTKIRKGKYSYLIVAVSATKCRRIRINATEKYLLNSLSHSSYTNYVSKTGVQESKNEVLTWLKKMYRLGIVQFQPLTNENKSKNSFLKTKEKTNVNAI